MALCKQAFEHSYENIVGLLPPVPVVCLFGVYLIRNKYDVKRQHGVAPRDKTNLKTPGCLDRSQEPNHQHQNCRAGET